MRGGGDFLQAPLDIKVSPKRPGAVDIPSFASRPGSCAMFRPFTPRPLSPERTLMNRPLSPERHLKETLMSVERRASMDKVRGKVMIPRPTGTCCISPTLTPDSEQQHRLAPQLSLSPRRGHHDAFMARRLKVSYISSAREQATIGSGIQAELSARCMALTPRATTARRPTTSGSPRGPQPPSTAPGDGVAEGNLEDYELEIPEDNASTQSDDDPDLVWDSWGYGSDSEDNN